MPIRFDHPDLLWLLLLALPVVWLGRRSLAALDPGRRWTAIVLRLSVLVILTLMLAGIQSVRWHDDLTVVAVVDESESIRRLANVPAAALLANPSLTMGQYMRQWIASATAQRRPDDRLALVTFDARPTVRAMPGPDIALDSDTLEDPRDGTDAAAALRLGMALFPPDSAKRMLLAGDGNESAPGQLLAAAHEAAAAGIRVDVLPIDYRVDHEVLVDGVYAPSEAREGQTVALRVVLRATRPTAGTLHLRHDGGWIDLSPGDAASTGVAVAPADWAVQEDAQSSGAAGRFVLVRLVQLPLTYSGANRFEAVFEPADEARDTVVANNRAQSFTLVQGKGRVLVLDNVEASGGDILPQSLRASGIEVDVQPGSAFPGSLEQLQRFDAVVFQNVPADMVTVAQQKLLASYVRDLGGGFIMIGGPDSFGAGGWTNSLVDEILPVHCQIPAQTVLPVGALLLVIDNSGSMVGDVPGTGDNKQTVANEAAVLAISTLYPMDIVGVLAFSDGNRWVVPLGVNGEQKDAAQRVRGISSGGGTQIFNALYEANRALVTLDAPQVVVRHVVLLTDGRGTNAEYDSLVRDMRAAGITLSTIGVGQDVDGELLAQLARHGGGRYYPIDDPRLLPRVFIKEARTVRKHLIKERPFAPQLLGSGSPITLGLDQPPPLRGLVLTGPKRDARIYNAMAGGDGEPLFAHWQLGLGRTAAFTSDATSKWAAAWLNWSGYADFWARTMRAIARPSASRDFDLLASLEGDTLHLRLDAAADRAADSYLNFLKVQGSVVGPEGEAQIVQLAQTGPGLYEARVPAQASGSYIVSLFATSPSGERQFVFGGANKLPGAELRRMESSRAVLEEVANITGGRVLDALSEPTAATLFDRGDDLPPSRSIRPLWWPLMPWLLALLLLDVACRRIAWDAGAAWRWTQARGAALRQVMTRRETQAAQTLEQLKRRAQEVDQQLGPKPADGRQPPPPPKRPPPRAPAPAQPTAQRKFESKGPAKPSGDFASSVGAAKPDAPQAPGPAKSGQPETPPPAQGPTTSRLLDAKRRARERLNDPNAKPDS